MPRYPLLSVPSCVNRLVRPIRECIWRSTRVGAVGWPVFEHRGAILTPLGGGSIAHSLIRPAHLAPCHDISYRSCALCRGRTLCERCARYNNHIDLGDVRVPLWRQSVADAESVKLNGEKHIYNIRRYAV